MYFFFCCLAAVLAILYLILVNCLVSVALVPSFMEKLGAFERITDESYTALVQTSDIRVNRQIALNETEVWQEKEASRKISAVTEDGYTLIAQEFPAKSDSHEWVLVLHGYTGWKEEMFPFARWYHGEGYHVIVPDLRCQGESAGDFIGMGWTDHYDSTLWIDYILSQDAEAQIVQNGAYQAIWHGASIKNPDYAKTWVYRIMLNECFRCLGQPKNLSYEAVREEYGMEMGYTEDAYGNIDLQRALEKLSPEDKAVIILRYFEDKKLEEIADILAENISAVKCRLYRSLKKLRGFLSDEGNRENRIQQAEREVQV